MIRHGRYRLNNSTYSAYSPVADFSFEAAKGLIDGYTTYKMFGFTPIAAISNTVLASWGMDFYQIDTAISLEVFSTSAFDDSEVNVGAKEIIVYGYNENFEHIEEVVVLAGTTPVLTNNTFIRVLRCSVTSTGAAGSNLGDIIIRDANSGYYYSCIKAQQLKSTQAYTVLEPDTAFILTDIHIGVRKSADSNAILSLRVKAPYTSIPENKLEFLTDTSTSIKLSSPFIIEPQLVPADIYFIARTTSSNVTEVPEISVIAEYMLVNQKAG